MACLPQIPFFHAIQIDLLVGVEHTHEPFGAALLSPREDCEGVRRARHYLCLARQRAIHLVRAFNNIDMMNTKSSLAVPCRKRPRPTSWGRVVMVGVWVALWTSGSIASSKICHSVQQSTGFVVAVATEATRTPKHGTGRRQRESTLVSRGGSSRSRHRRQRSPLPVGPDVQQPLVRKVVPLDNTVHDDDRDFENCSGDDDGTFDWYCSDYRDDTGEMRDGRTNPKRQRRRTPKREYPTLFLELLNACATLAPESDDTCLTLLHSILAFYFARVPIFMFLGG
jgi:hypothetical protein